MGEVEDEQEVEDDEEPVDVVQEEDDEEEERFTPWQGTHILCMRRQFHLGIED